MMAIGFFLFLFNWFAYDVTVHKKHPKRITAHDWVCLGFVVGAVLMLASLCSLLWRWMP